MYVAYVGGCLCVREREGGRAERRVVGWQYRTSIEFVVFSNRIDSRPIYSGEEMLERELSVGIGQGDGGGGAAAAVAGER